ncbi:hypothetical protein D9M71_333030 [compost metagenome]
MIRHIERTHGTKEDGIEGLQFFQATLGDVVTVFQVVIGVPVEVFEIELEAGFFRQGLQYLHTGSDDFHTNAITWDSSDFVCAHDQLHTRWFLVVPAPRGLSRRGVKGVYVVNKEQ